MGNDATIQVKIDSTIAAVGDGRRVVLRGASATRLRELEREACDVRVAGGTIAHQAAEPHGIRTY